MTLVLSGQKWSFIYLLTRRESSFCGFEALALELRDAATSVYDKGLKVERTRVSYSTYYNLLAAA